MSEPWDPLRDVAVPAGAKARVRAALDERRAPAPRPARRPRRAALVLVGVAALGASAAAAMSTWTARPATPVGPRAVAVADGASAEVTTRRGRARVAGPARATLMGETVVLRDGTLDALGAFAVTDGRCTAAIDGASQVSVVDGAMTVRVFAGTARIVTAAPRCEVIELRAATATDADPPARAASAPRAAIDADPDAIAAAAPAVAPLAIAPPPPSTRSPLAVAPPAPRGRPAALRPRSPSPAAPPVAATEAPAVAVTPTPAVDEPRAAADPEAAARPAPSTGDPLAEQVDAYRAAVALEAVAPSDAVAAWGRFTTRWPRSSLAPSAALRRIALLGRLGRRDEQRHAAQAFLARYPDNPRAAEIRALGAAP